MHMVQHMLFTFVAAPLLVVGMPAWMWRHLLRPYPLRRVWAFLTRPLVALIVGNGVLLFVHWPEIVDLSVRSEVSHFALHTVLLGSAVVVWWPIVSPLPELPGLSPPGQMLYLFFQSLAPTIPASFLTFGTHPLYPIYATFPRIWGISPLTDQLIAGLVMKLVVGAVAGVAMLAGGVAIAVIGPPEPEIEPQHLTLAAPKGAVADGFSTDALSAEPGKPIDLEFDNEDAGIGHNVVIFDGPDDKAPTLFEGDVVTGPTKAEY